jgi:hypothetical protein
MHACCLVCAAAAAADSKLAAACHASCRPPCIRMQPCTALNSVELDTFDLLQAAAHLRHTLGFDELAAAGPFVFGWAAAVELPPNRLLMIPMVPTPASAQRQAVVRAALLGPDRPGPGLGDSATARCG